MVSCLVNGGENIRMPTKELLISNAATLLSFDNPIGYYSSIHCYSFDSYNC